jgi:hypothetical protein
MPDEADQADQQIEAQQQSAVNAAHRVVQNMPEGEAGECDRCGEERPRLVDFGHERICCRCRDKYGLP